MRSLQGLIAVMRDARKLLALPGNDFAWSSWEDRKAALAEVDAHIATLERGAVPDLSVLFLATGPIRKSA